LKDIIKKSMEELSEDIIALTSKEYIKSIEEARLDYKKREE